MYPALVALLAVSAWGGQRVWIETQTKVAVSGAFKLCGLIELYHQENGHYPIDGVDVVQLLKNARSPHNSAPYLSGGDSFFSERDRLVEYRRTADETFSVVLPGHPAVVGFMATTPSVRCENSNHERAAANAWQNCSCGLGP
jgi:hypothetical protein